MKYVVTLAKSVGSNAERLTDLNSTLSKWKLPGEKSELNRKRCHVYSTTEILQTNQFRFEQLLRTICAFTNIKNTFDDI